MAIKPRRAARFANIWESQVLWQKQRKSRQAKPEQPKERLFGSAPACIAVGGLVSKDQAR
jgi:hypothetical protein